MSRILVCKDNEDLNLKKSKAFQYKSIDLTSLSCGSLFNIEDAGEKLVGVANETGQADEPIYTIVANEFGLYAMSDGISAKVKVSFCDNDMMVIDVLEGAVLIKPEDDVLLVSRGETQLPNVNLEKILWVNADMLLSYARYWGELKSRYVQDFEYVFVLKGENRDGKLESFGIKLVEEEVVDISGGKIAVLEAQLKAKEEALQAKKNFANLMKHYENTSYEFDDDDDYEEEDEEDSEDIYEEEVDDGSGY